MILEILRIQPLILDFPYLLTQKSTALLKNLVRNFFKQKKYFILFLPYEGVVGGGGGQKHVNIVLGRSHNSSDGLN